MRSRPAAYLPSAKMCAADLPTLAEQGGTSLDAAKIAGLYAELGVPLQRVMQILLHASSVGAAAQRLRTERQAYEARDPPLVSARVALISP